MWSIDGRKLKDPKEGSRVCRCSRDMLSLISCLTRSWGTHRLCNWLYIFLCCKEIQTLFKTKRGYPELEVNFWFSRHQHGGFGWFSTRRCRGRSYPAHLLEKIGLEWWINNDTGLGPWGGWGRPTDGGPTSRRWFPHVFGTMVPMGGPQNRISKPEVQFPAGLFFHILIFWSPFGLVVVMLGAQGAGHFPPWKAAMQLLFGYLVYFRTRRLN